MNLTDLKSRESYSNSRAFVWKKPNAIPSKRTVNTFVDSKIAVSQKQLGTVLSKKEDSTIYTDETRKYGKTLEAY